MGIQQLRTRAFLIRFLHLPVEAVAAAADDPPQASGLGQLASASIEFMGLGTLSTAAYTSPSMLVLYFQYTLCKNPTHDRHGVGAVAKVEDFDCCH